MTALDEVQRAFARICFERSPSEEDLALLCDDRERWLMYRQMVRHRLFGMMRLGLPRTAELLGKARFQAAGAAYLAEQPPESRFIRDVVPELLRHALPALRADPTLPPHLPDLARYEAAKWAVASLEWEAADAGELDFEAPAVINPTVRVVPIDHRVDKPAEAATGFPRLAETHHALVYRKPGSAPVFTYVLNDIGGRLFAAWTKDQSCADGAREVLAELGRTPDARFIDGMAGVLAALVEQSVILGSRR